MGEDRTKPGDKSAKHGQARLYVDDVPARVVSQKSNDEQKSVEVFSMDGLDRGSHELFIEIVCPRDAEQCGEISIDAIDVVPYELSEERMGQ